MLMAKDKNGNFLLHSRKILSAFSLLLFGCSALLCQNMGSSPYYLRRFSNYLRRFSISVRTKFLLCRTKSLLSRRFFQQYPNCFLQKHLFHSENTRFLRHFLIAENRVVAPNPPVTSICALNGGT